MGSNEKPVQLKVYVDENKKKVMFAEAEQDFVDILFSFMTLPLGTIATLSRKYAADSKDIKVGSLTCLYESAVNLNEKHFSCLWHPWYKSFLVHPRNLSSSLCQKLKVNLNEATVAGCACDAVFGNFIITDNLNVSPVMFDTSIKLLHSLGVENINLLQERTMCFGLEEFLNLLKWSITTANPLTNLVFGGGIKPCSSSSSSSSSSCITNSSTTALQSSNSGQKVIKLLLQKLNGTLLCAQVDSFLLELVFSFLAIPLGACIRLTKDDSSSPILGVNNLYNSISCLGDENYLKSEDVKTMLLCPKPDADFFCVTDLLQTNQYHFLKEEASFLVSNNLEISASPSITTLSYFNTIGVHVGDMEVLEVGIGEYEVLSLLRASLTSTSALTDCFGAPIKKRAIDKINAY